MAHNHKHGHDHGACGQAPPPSGGRSEADKIPVTVLSGFLGAGKTTLLKHVLEQREEDMRVAVIVNDMAEINIDSALVREGASLKQVEEKLVELSNGCICCTLREDLVKEVRALADEGRFDYILVESTGVSEPMPVAESFYLTLPELGPLQEVARLDTMVTVVDGSTVVDLLMNSEQQLAERFSDLPEEDDRSLSQLLTDQIEFANVILLNKVDRIAEGGLPLVHDVLRKLNRGALIYETSFSKVPLNTILNTSLFKVGGMPMTAGWLTDMRALTNEKTPETEEYRIASFVYRRRRPFHPLRIGALFEGEALKNLAILRAKGFVWVASCMATYGEWCQVGKVADIEGGSAWYVEQDREDWPMSEEGKVQIESEFLPLSEQQELRKGEGELTIGDRRQEVVFIAQDMNVPFSSGESSWGTKRHAIEEALDACLLTDGEWERDPATWVDWENPFWDEAEEELEDEDEDGEGHGDAGQGPSGVSMEQ